MALSSGTARSHREIQFPSPSPPAPFPPFPPMSDAPKRKAGDEPQAAEAAKKTKEEEAASTETEETKEDASSSSSNKTKATTRDSPCTGCGTTDFEAWIHCDSCASRVCSACDPQKRICSVEGECGVVCCGDCRSGGDAEWVPCDECGQVVCTSCMDSGTKVLGEAAADMAITVPPSFKLCLVCIQEDALETIVQKFAGGSCRMCSKPSGEAQCDLCEASFCHSCSTNLGEPGSDAVKRIAGDAYGRGHLVHTCDGCDVLICQNCATGKNYKGGGGRQPQPLYVVRQVPEAGVLQVRLRRQVRREARPLALHGVRRG